MTQVGFCFIQQGCIILDFNFKKKNTLFFYFLLIKESLYQVATKLSMLKNKKCFLSIK